MRAKRHFLKASEIKSVFGEVSGKLTGFVSQFFGEKSQVEVVETDFGRIFLIEGRPLLFERDRKVFPTLVFGDFVSKAARIIVDMGAVPHVCNGADVMRPGIVRFEGDFVKGDLVVVADTKYGKPLLIGEASCEKASAESLKYGTVVKNIHHVGDDIWDLVKSFG